VEDQNSAAKATRTAPDGLDIRDDIASRWELHHFRRLFETEDRRGCRVGSPTSSATL
jgi:hypothetical protein